MMSWFDKMKKHSRLMRQRVIYSLVFYKIGQKKGWNVLLRISIVSENYENEMNNLIELS